MPECDEMHGKSEVLVSKHSSRTWQVGARETLCAPLHNHALSRGDTVAMRSDSCMDSAEDIEADWLGMERTLTPINSTGHAMPIACVDWREADSSVIGGLYDTEVNRW